MIYEINDRTLIEEMCGDIRNTVRAEYTALEEKNKKMESSCLAILHILWMKTLLAHKEC